MIHQEQLENMGYIKHLGSTITNDARSTREIKSTVAMVAKALFNKWSLFTSKLDFNLRNKLVTCYIWGTALCGAEMWILRNFDQKYVESFKMWCWRMMEKIIWTDPVRNEVLQRIKEERNILPTIRERKANRIGHPSCRNCLPKHVIEGKIEGRIEVIGRRGGRRRQLLDNLTEKRRYWKLKKDALDCAL
jgi:hypothetical protein